MVQYNFIFHQRNSYGDNGDISVHFTRNGGKEKKGYLRLSKNLRIRIKYEISKISVAFLCFNHYVIPEKCPVCNVQSAIVDFPISCRSRIRCSFRKMS